MTQTTLPGSSGTAAEVRKLQAAAALRGLPVTLGSALVVAASEALVLYEEALTVSGLVWIAAFLGLTALRAASLMPLRRRLKDGGDARRILRCLTVQSFCAALIWSAIPLMQVGSMTSATGAFTVFMLGGVSVGALVQSFFYAPIAIAFFVPNLLATAFALFLEGDLTAMVVGLNALLLMVMMIIQGRRGTYRFVSGETARLDAEGLATSLAEANEKLQFLADHDQMTGLYNRRMFDRCAEEELARGRRQGTLCCLILFDVDHFKHFNDSYGHHAGDRALARIAEAAASVARRSTDKVFRIGGEEFAILTLGTHAEETEIVAARLCEAVRALAIPHAASAPGHVTVSAGGVTVHPGCALSFEQVYVRADGALYKAKAAGRDRFVIAEDSDAERELDVAAQ